MNGQLETLKNKIFFGEHLEGEWRKIKRETDIVIKNSTKEDIQEFVDSGAGSLLEQIIEYL